ncbi:hypothetical protein NE865_13257 [Phthorimaea operculella]|nr:hypothetical protein NE865_13257 [Phthorimaea operculella]
MRSLSLVLYVAIASCAVKVNSEISDDLQGEASSTNSLIGVASVAGITSRNGRVSSVRGVKFFPGSSPEFEYFNPLEYSNGDVNSYPFTVSTQRDGKFASVHSSPGYISASAGSGFGPPSTEYNPRNVGQQRSLNGFFYQPQTIFGPRQLQSWFPKDLFQGFHPSAHEVRNGWLINNFNPFMNFWR